VREILITQGKIAIVDEEDYARVSEHPWYFTTRGYAASTSRGIDGLREELLLHRLILSAEKGVVVDHINGNKLDNRRENLRLATQSTNLANSKISAANTSGYKGVSWNKRARKYEAGIYFQGKRTYLGLFLTADAAALAYNVAATEMFGEYARLNVIQDEEEAA
jgi:hypothetical protein